MSDKNTEQEDFWKKHEEMLEKLRSEGKIDNIYLTPEEQYMMVQATNNYIKQRDISAKEAALKKLIAEFAKVKPKPSFKRVKKYSYLDRFKVLNEEIRKVMFSNIRIPSGKIEFIEVEGFNSEIPREEMVKAPFWDQFKFKIIRINRTRLGRLRWYEKIYSFFSILYKSLRNRDE